MPADVFFDTSVLVYTLVREDRRATVAEELLFAGGFISVQVLNELVAVGRRKLDMSWEEIGAALTSIRELCGPPMSLTIDIHENAVRIAEQFGYRIYDALILAAALKAECSILYSEDMQDGQSIEKMTIRNPFR